MFYSWLIHELRRIKMSSKSKTSTPAEIWKNLNKVSDNLKELAESQKETKLIMKQKAEENEADFARFKARQAEAAEESRADFAELRAIQKKTELVIEKIGSRFDQRWGDLVEALVRGKLVKIFKEQNIDIKRTYTEATSEWEQPNGKVKKREFDIVVANGTEAVVVEVKTTLEARDVHYFLDNLTDFKKYFPRHKPDTIYGAMAYLKAKKGAGELAEENGLFIIRATGDSAHLVNKAGFKPKEFA